MIVDFENTGPNQKDLEDACYFFAGQLLHKRTLDVLDIMIEFEEFERNTAGFCMWQEAQDYVITIDPRMSKFKMLETLAHEMIHVKQYAKKELVEKPDGTTLWKKTRYDRKDVDYMNFPWEIEAYAKERELLKSYLKWRKSR